jgi:hypothetical protein
LKSFLKPISSPIKHSVLGEQDHEGSGGGDGAIAATKQNRRGMPRRF